MAEMQKGSRIFLYIAVCTGNLVAFSAGIALGWSSPVLEKLKSEAEVEDNPFGRIITPDEESWIGSLLALGAIFGPLVAGFCADKIGRKRTLLIWSGIPLIISYLMTAFGKVVVLYYVARFIAGFALGGVFTVLPNFISEIAEDSVRGAVCSSMNVFVVSGPLFSYAVGPYVPIMWFNIVCAIWPTIFTVGFFLLAPESPYHLIAVNDSLGAAKSLRKYRGLENDDGIRKELETIKRTVDESMQTRSSFLDIFKSKGTIKAMIIALALVGFQQFSGINTVLFYSQNIFAAAGSTIPSEISTIIVGSVQVLASFITPLLVDRMGRKLLLIISGVGMLIAEVPLGLYFYLQDGKQDVSSIFWLPILCLIVYIIVYNFGFGPLPWTVMAEIFPSNVKAPASTATASFCWILGFLITKFFSSISVKIGMSGSFWLFSGFCLIAVIFVLVYMIETKGRSFQEIQEILAN